MADIACGLALVFPFSQVPMTHGLRVSTLTVVEKRDRRLNHDLAFGDPGDAATEQPVIATID